MAFEKPKLDNAKKVEWPQFYVDPEDEEFNMGVVLWDFLNVVLCGMHVRVENVDGLRLKHFIEKFFFYVG